jgi:subtilase family serine protease
MEPIYDSTKDLVARRTATPPTIDGVVESAWSDALALGTFITGDNGNYDLDLYAMFDDDYVYLLASWDETHPTIPIKEDRDREAWELTSNVTPGTWDHKTWGEDRVSFLWQDPDNPVENFNARGCDAICHDQMDMFTLNPGEILDAWVWSAATTNPQGYADDGVLLTNNSVTPDPKRMHINASDLDWDSGNDGWWVNNDTSSVNPRPTHVWKPGASPADPSFMFETDSDEVVWSTFDISTIAQGTIVPGHILRTPGGDRADIMAKGVHNGTGWNVEFKRLRDTGSTDDVAFDTTNVPYYFGPAITNNMTGDKHSKGTTSYRLWLAEPEEPDLVVKRINPVGSTFIVNSTIQVGVFVENKGWADAAATRLSYEWEDSGVLAHANVDAIPWGQEKYVLLTVDTTDLTPGNSTLIVNLDVDGTVTEINETNNGANLTLDLAAEPLADLWVESFSILPLTPTEGGFAQIQAVVRNDGTNASEPVIYNISVVEASTLLEHATLPSIAVNTTHTIAYTWGPISLSAGDYTILVTVDGDSMLKELDEDNNHLATIITIAAPSMPDLIVESVVPLSESVTQGTETAAQVTIANVGGSVASTNFEVALFLDEPFTIGINGLVGTIPVTDDIPAGSNATVVISWTVPNEAVEGKHFIRAEVDWIKSVDELDDDNNNATFADLIVLPRPLPDLVVSAVTPDNPTAKKETLLHLTITVGNTGSLASSITTLAILDVDHNITLNSITVPVINVSDSVNLEFEWLVTGVSVGQLTLQFQVDAVDNIREESEFNNALSTILTVLPADLADLMIPEGGVIFTPAEPRIGDAVTISITVANAGTKASDNTTIEVFVGNTQISKQNLLVLGVGESRTLDVIWAATTIVSPLEYQIPIKLDPEMKVNELDEGNNELVELLTFVMPPQPLLEDMVLDINKDKVKTGNEIVVTVSIKNTGDAPDLITIVVKDGATEIASKQAITVAAGGNKTETFTVTLKGTGDHAISATIYRGTEVVQDPLGNDFISELSVKVEKKPDDNPGFGSVLAVIAILGALIVARSKRQRR